MAFQRAKVKYSGGKIGDVINLILITAILNLACLAAF
jgi:hypothetical protein